MLHTQLVCHHSVEKLAFATVAYGPVYGSVLQELNIPCVAEEGRARKHPKLADKVFKQPLALVLLT